jgi:hypothetical protein
LSSGCKELGGDAPPGPVPVVAPVVPRSPWSVRVTVPVAPARMPGKESTAPGPMRAAAGGGVVLLVEAGRLGASVRGWAALASGNFRPPIGGTLSVFSTVVRQPGAIATPKLSQLRIATPLNQFLPGS